MERHVAGVKPCDPLKVIQSHQWVTALRPFGFSLIKAPLRESGLVRMY